MDIEDVCRFFFTKLSLCDLATETGILRPITCAKNRYRHFTKKKYHSISNIFNTKDDNLCFEKQIFFQGETEHGM